MDVETLVDLETTVTRENYKKGQQKLLHRCSFMNKIFGLDLSWTSSLLSKAAPDIVERATASISGDRMCFIGA